MTGLLVAALLARRRRTPRRRGCWSPPTSGCCVSSRQKVAAGRLEIQLYNRGEDAHDLAARRVNRDGKRVGRTFRVRETRPGDLGEATWRLKSGKYSLWCDLPGHRAAGMRATLRAR